MVEKIHATLDSHIAYSQEEVRTGMVIHFTRYIMNRLNLARVT